VRIATALNRLLRLPGASVIDVSITHARSDHPHGPVATPATGSAPDAGRSAVICRSMVVALSAGATSISAPAAASSNASCDACAARRAGSISSPWRGRPDAHHTRDFENVVAWLAPSRPRPRSRSLLRVGWGTVGKIVTRVVADQLDERRLGGPVAIGCDEIRYRRGRRYLTSVVNHESGAIVWCAAGRNAATLQRFFDELGDRRESIRAVSIDMAGGYAKAIRDIISHADIYFGPFHVIRLAQRAGDQVRRDEWNAHELSHTRTGKWGAPIEMGVKVIAVGR
jgi:transposase